MDQNSQNIVLVNNTRITWPTYILMLFLSSLDNFLQDAYIIFQKGVDNFEIVAFAVWKHFLCYPLYPISPDLCFGVP